MLGRSHDLRLGVHLRVGELRPEHLVQIPALPISSSVLLKFPHLKGRRMKSSLQLIRLSWDLSKGSFQGLSKPLPNVSCIYSDFITELLEGQAKQN